MKDHAYLKSGIMLFLVTLALSSFVLALTTTYYSGNLGLITTEVEGCGIFCRLFTPQTFTTSKDVYNTGDTVSFTSNGACPSTLATSAYVTIKDPTAQNCNVCPSGSITKLSLTLPNAALTTPGYLWTVKSSFVVAKEGTYSFEHCWTCNDATFPKVCDPVKTITVQKVYTSCPAEKYLEKAHDYNREANTPNIDSAFCYLYEKYTLTNGECVRSEYCKSYETLCLDGYVCQGTENKLCNGYKSCVSPTTISPDQSNPTPTTECDADITFTCKSDGKIITIQKCTNGELVTTDEKCAVVSDDTNTNTNTPTTPSVQIAAVDQYKWYIIGGIILLIGGVIIYYLYKK